MDLLVNITYDFTEIPMKMIVNLKRGGSSETGGGGGGGGGLRELHETPLESRHECHAKILSGSATIKRTVSGCQTEVLPGSVETKLLPVSITIKSTNKEYHH